MLARLVVLCGLFLVVGLSPAFAQQEARSSTKGASTPLPITGTSVDADHNALDVYIRGGASGSGGGTEFNEDTSHSSGAAGTLMLGVRNDAGGTTFTDTNGDYSPIAVDNLGRVIISILSLSPGTSAANLGKAEDAGHSSGDVGVMSLCVRRDTAATSATTDGDYNPCATDANGKLWTNADTEMPAAATLVDDTANPTVPGVASFNMCFDGSTWDRCTKATAGNGAVDTATQRVTIANDSTGNLATIGTSVTPGTSAAHLGKAEDGAHTTGDTGVMLLGVRAASPTDRSAGPTDGDYEPLGINAAGAVWTTPTPTTAGGLTTHYLTSAASTNSTNVKNAAGQVYLIRAVNTTSTLYFLRMYNASAAPTCSSATNFIETIPIPASASGAGIVIPQYMGQTYATGISYCLTGGGSSTDNTNAATGVYLTILYK